MKVIDSSPQTYGSLLVDRLRSGDPGAREELYHAYRDRLNSFVSRQLDGEQAAAEDIVQEIFLAAFGSLDTFRGDSKLYTWLCGIAHHKIADFYRSIAREASREQPGPDVDPLNNGMNGDNVPLAPDVIESTEAYHLVQQSLVDLPADYREVIALKYFEGMSVSEIGQVMERSAKSVEGLLSRARNALRTRLVAAATGN